MGFFDGFGVLGEIAEALGIGEVASDAVRDAFGRRDEPDPAESGAPAERRLTRRRDAPPNVNDL